ncbi:amino acid adenylation domain-containing protein [Streptomyces sp. NPDC051907]|uniref:non-ribosomal peptide synthetase n=1 Tax=Streptomyces sp. NPDC051907 TaxID=3155284 RepID=UPI0034487D41
MTSTEPTDVELDAQRRELLRLMLAEAGLEGQRTTSLEPEPVPADGAAERGADGAVEGGADGAPGGVDAAPLSSAEQRMRFLQQLHPDGSAYNLCGGVRLTGPLDPAALGAALTALTGAHDVLRTLYPVDEDGSPTRKVMPPAEVVLAPAEPVDVPAAERAAAAARLIEREGRGPFALACELPARFRLFRLGDDDHLLVLVVHHIAFDDLSWGRVLDELAQRYTHAVDGSSPSDLPPARQYAAFARWEARRLAAGDWEGQLDYWRSALRPQPPALTLPTDLPRPDEASSAGVRRELRIGAEDSDVLRQLARDCGATLFTVLLAAYQTLLHRWSSETDIAVGSPVINRSLAEFEEVVGNFGNTVVLRTDLGGDPSFRELVRRVRDTCADAFAHQDIPYDRVTEALRPAGASGQTALFDTMFSFVAAAARRAPTPTVLFEELPHHNGTARFALVVEARDALDGIVLGITARADLFSPAAVERMLGHLASLIGGALRDPDRRLSELPVLSAEEERLALTDWSRSHDEPAVDRPLHRLVAEQAARTPDLVAVVGKGGALTYRQLDELSNALAVRLRALGAGPERVVGVHLTRSPELIVALLAVLKSGGAFMPLEPSWPALRLETVARGARPALVLTHSGSTPALPPLDAPVLDLAVPAAEEERVDAAAGPDAATATATATDMENVAYVIHTSGSTGAPKGVMIRHQAIANRLVWQSALLGMESDDVVLHKAPMGFDISVNEIFLPLVNGARLVLADPGAEGDVGHLTELIEREKVTFLYIVASMLDVMLEREDVSSAARSIRHLWCGGEALTPELYRRFRSRLDATMYHGYGPAEATIGVSCRVFDERAEGAAISIGRPNPNARLHLLDPGLRPVAVGTPGELYIGGMPLARGYLHDPARTAEAFVPDPFGGEPGGRLYRTGDLGRYRADGQIEFLGRADNQVKVRGFRIELEEVESALGAHPAVRQAVVLARSDQLAAWCTTQQDVTPGALRDWLAARLPHYCVPGEIQLLDALPLTSAGKVDRKELLSRPPAERAAPAEPFVQPRDVLEREIAAVWGELLGRSDVGVHHNFFDLGGHSLLLARAQTLYRARLGRELPLVELYDHPTVASLAKRLSADAAAGAKSGAEAELDGARARALLQRQAATAGRRVRPRAGRTQQPGERTRGA